MSERGGSASAEVGGGTVGDFQTQLAAAAEDRAESWAAVADVLDVPDEARTARLRSGDQAAAWLQHCRWLGPDADVLAAPATTLETYARASRRRDAGDDLTALAVGHARLVGPEGTVIATHAAAVAELCRVESAAWAAGDMPAGRAARTDERAVLDAEVVPRLVPIAVALVHEAEGHVWRTIGRTLLAVLSVETGTDHMAAAG